jgi:DNA-binding NtrC family response regulator
MRLVTLSSPVSGAGPKKRLLIVEPTGGAALRAALGEHYDTTVSLTAQEAFGLLSRGVRFDVIVSVLELKPMNGAVFLRKVLAEHRGTLGVLISLYADYLKLGEPSGSDSFLLLMRPYQTPQLLETVRRAARFAQLRQGVAAVNADLKVAR